MTFYLKQVWDTAFCLCPIFPEYYSKQVKIRLKKKQKQARCSQAIKETTWNKLILTQTDMLNVMLSDSYRVGLNLIRVSTVIQRGIQSRIDLKFLEILIYTVLIAVDRKNVINSYWIYHAYKFMLKYLYALFLQN